MWEVVAENWRCLVAAYAIVIADIQHPRGACVLGMETSHGVGYDDDCDADAHMDAGSKS